MRSNNFPDKEALDMPPDMEGVTRAKKTVKLENIDLLSMVLVMHL